MEDDFDILVCPGGLKGAENLALSIKLNELILNRHTSGQKIAAICASPALVLAPLKVLQSHKATCYPSFHGHLPNYINQPVVVDEHIITSQGPATSSAFALEIITQLEGADIAAEVAKQALYA